MGFEELLQAIGEEAGRQRSAILAGAEAEARAIVARAEAGLPAEFASLKAAAAAAARAEAARILSRARLAARREVLAARAEVIAAALRALEERLAALPAAGGYHVFLGRLVDECLAEAADPVTLRCRPEDRMVVEERARGSGREIAVEEVPLALGGVEAVFGPEGRCVVRNTFTERLERSRPLLLQEVGRLLFGEEEGRA
ncbi:MAG TPA: V-type ATP synthase subunit E [Candidatus Methanoperedens sp.]|nr:V-type ATP synthase subunit E [Candidatus Methanoperedens sp.]